MSVLLEADPDTDGFHWALSRITRGELGSDTDTGMSDQERLDRDEMRKSIILFATSASESEGDQEGDSALSGYCHLVERDRDGTYVELLADQLEDADPSQAYYPEVVEETMTAMCAVLD